MASYDRHEEYEKTNHCPVDVEISCLIGRNQARTIVLTVPVKQAEPGDYDWDHYAATDAAGIVESVLQALVDKHVKKNGKEKKT